MCTPNYPCGEKHDTADTSQALLVDSLREEIRRLRAVVEDKSWDAIKESAVFFLRGTVKDLAREDISNFNDGREFLFVMIPAARTTQEKP